MQETKFLGLLVSTTGLKMDLDKVAAVTAWEVPIYLKKVQSFVRFYNFYRRFIKDFLKTVKPLVALTKKDCPFL